MFFRKKHKDAHDPQAGPTDHGADDEMKSAQDVSIYRNPAFLSTISGVPMAFGLAWDNLYNNQKDVKSIVPFGDGYVLYPVGNTAYVGYGATPVVGKYAAGLVVGSQYRNAIVYHIFEGMDAAWVCVIQDGVPWADCDVVVRLDVANTKFQEFAALTAQAQRIGNYHQSMVPLEQVVESFTKLTQGKQKTYKLLKNGYNYLKLMGWLVLIGAVCAGGVMGWQYQERLRDEAKRKQLMEDMLRSQQEKAAEQARLRASAERFMKSVEEARANFSRSNTAQLQWSLCEGVRRTLPVSAHGYNPVRMSCDFNSKKATVEWMPNNKTTRVADRVNLPGVVQQLDTNNPVRSEFPLDYDSNAGSPSKPEDKAVIKMTILDWTGMYMPSSRFQADELVTMTPPPDVAGKVIEGIPPVPAFNLGWKSRFDLNANTPRELISLPDAIAMLDKYAIRFDRMDWTTPTRSGMTFKGSAILYLPGIPGLNDVPPAPPVIPVAPK